MREICLSGSMSGERKRSVAERPKLPRLSSTLPILDPYANTYSKVSSGDIGESYENNENIANYAATRNILLSENAPGASILPSSSPDPGNLYMGSAEAKAFGFLGASSTLDGSVGISANTTWDYSPTATPTATNIIWLEFLSTKFLR